MCNWLYKWYRPDGKLAPEQIADVFVDLLEGGYLRRAAEAGGRSGLVALRSPAFAASGRMRSCSHAGHETVCAMEATQRSRSPGLVSYPPDLARVASARRKKLPSVTICSPGSRPSSTSTRSPMAAPSFTGRSSNCPVFSADVT